MRTFAVRAVKGFKPLHMLYRLGVALRVPFDSVKTIIPWVFQSNEDTNFTYDLKELNLRYLESFVSQVSGMKEAAVRAYMDELIGDTDLASHIRRLTAASRFRRSADLEVRYGRRLGWYALIRAHKPQVVVETGTDKGLGSCVIAAALMRNSQDGNPGYLYSIDINEKAGYLFEEPYSEYGEILVGSSLEILGTIDRQIDLFIHDSNHDPDFEAQEFSTVEPLLSNRALILSDNAHISDRLWQYAQTTGRKFLYFQESPRNHWYPGAGIGAAFP